ncbi:hypothetical protein ACF0H5_003813 [Mactra antiquata]
MINLSSVTIIKQLFVQVLFCIMCNMFDNICQGLFVWHSHILFSEKVAHVIYYVVIILEPRKGQGGRQLGAGCIRGLMFPSNNFCIGRSKKDQRGEKRDRVQYLAILLKNNHFIMSAVGTDLLCCFRVSFI